jgi:hypothetical protein
MADPGDSARPARHELRHRRSKTVTEPRSAHVVVAIMVVVAVMVVVVVMVPAVPRTPRSATPTGTGNFACRLQNLIGVGVSRIGGVSGYPRWC